MPAGQTNDNGIIFNQRLSMKNWAWLVAGLYVLIIMVLTVPVGWAAFAPHATLKDVGSSFAAWQYWLWLAVMLAGQVALLAVPVRVASMRPVTRGPVWRTILAGGLMAGGLGGGAFLSIYEFVFRDKNDFRYPLWIAVGLGVLTWIVWAVIFARMGRTTEPADLVTRQCQWLFKGSILELLIAVPTHIVARYRDYCCAGILTFIGLTMGFSVMLFSFGPAVFFLAAARWKRLHPKARD